MHTLLMLPFGTHFLLFHLELSVAISTTWSSAQPSLFVFFPVGFARTGMNCMNRHVSLRMRSVVIFVKFTSQAGSDSELRNVFSNQSEHVKLFSITSCALKWLLWFISVDLFIHRVSASSAEKSYFVVDTENKAHWSDPTKTVSFPSAPQALMKLTVYAIRVAPLWPACSINLRAAL